ncbi:MAG: NUDIX domain-containing protein [archaeon]
MEQETKQKILRHLIHFPSSSYSQLWDKKIPSNKFTYYLNQLTDKGYIEKKNSKYSLTTKGKHLEASLDGNTGETRKRPFVAVVVVVKKDNKYLMCERLKEPYYGSFGFIGGKVEFGEDILKCAQRELFEETNLKGKGKIFIIDNIKTYENNKELAHYVHYGILFENTKGKLLPESMEGKFSFVKKREFIKHYKEKQLYPAALKLLNTIPYFKKTNRIKGYDVKIYIENQKYVKTIFKKMF